MFYQIDVTKYCLLVQQKYNRLIWMIFWKFIMSNHSFISITITATTVLPSRTKQKNKKNKKHVMFLKTCIYLLIEQRGQHDTKLNFHSIKTITTLTI